MLSNLTMSILTPASSYFFRHSRTLSIGAESRHLRSASLASAVAPRSNAACGAPAYSSTGCDRSSTALIPSLTQPSRVSSALIRLLLKLYGTFRPIWTPATFESGLAGSFCAACHSRRGSSVAPGTATSASFPSLRLVYNMMHPSLHFSFDLFHERRVELDVDHGSAPRVRVEVPFARNVVGRVGRELQRVGFGDARELDALIVGDEPVVQHRTRVEIHR